MRQTALFVPLQLLGALICVAVGPRRWLHLCAALGFAVGTAAVVCPIVLFAGYGAPYGPALPILVYAVVAAACVWRVRRQPLERREWRILGLWSAAFAVVAFSLTLVNVSVLTFDSHGILLLGRVFAEGHGFEGMLHMLHNRGAFLVVVHSAAILVGGMDYLYAFAAVLGVSFVAVFAVALAQAAQRGPGWVALVTAALFTSYLLHLHFIYIHENLGSTVYLFVYVALWWLAETTDDPAPMPIAFVALTAFCLFRVENPIVAVLFLALTIVPSALPRRAVAPWFGAFTLVVVGWYLRLMAGLPAQGSALTLGKGTTMTALVAVVFVGWALAPRARWLAAVSRRAPLALGATFVLALAVAFVTRWWIMMPSAASLLHNLTSWPEWGVTWIGVLALALLAAFTPRPAGWAPFVIGIPSYFVLVLLFSWGRGSYIVAWTDSAIRMSLHILPLALFYVGLKAPR